MYKKYVIESVLDVIDMITSEIDKGVDDDRYKVLHRERNYWYDMLVELGYWDEYEALFA